MTSARAGTDSESPTAMPHSKASNERDIAITPYASVTSGLSGSIGTSLRIASASTVRGINNLRGFGRLGHQGCGPGPAASDRRESSKGLSNRQLRVRVSGHMVHMRVDQYGPPRLGAQFSRGTAQPLDPSRSLGSDFLAGNRYVDARVRSQAETIDRARL